MMICFRRLFAEVANDRGVESVSNTQRVVHSRLSGRDILIDRMDDTMDLDR